MIAQEYDSSGRSFYDEVRWSNATKSGVDWDWCFSPCSTHQTWGCLALLLQNLQQPTLSLSAHKQPLPSSRLNGGCYGNFGRGIKVRLPGEVKRAVNPPFLSPRELTESARRWLREGEEEVGGWQTPARSRALELLARLHAQKKTYVGSFFLKEDITVQFCFFSSNSDAK